MDAGKADCNTTDLKLMALKFKDGNYLISDWLHIYKDAFAELTTKITSA